MTKHSKHGNARPFQTQAEGDRIRRLSASGGSDITSSLPFGHCCVSLKPPKTPMASPQGLIFDKDVVIEYIMSQRSESYNALPSSEYSANVPKQIARTNTADSFASQARSNAFWLAPDTKSVTGICKQPDLPAIRDGTPRCPVTGKKLRLKDLIPLTLEGSTEKERDEGIYCCAVSKKPIGHNQAVLLKPSGVVVLESVLNQSSGSQPSHCPVSGVPLSPEDVIKLHKGRPLA